MKDIKQLILDSQIIAESDLIIIPFLKYFNMITYSNYTKKYHFDTDKMLKLINVINTHFNNQEYDKLLQLVLE